MHKKIDASQYQDWKRWDLNDFLTVNQSDRAYFDAEARRAGVSGDGLRVLELGFGNGAFLAYAMERGWKCAGTEANELLLERARANNVEVYPASEELEKSFYPQSVDAVFAFDVVEHMNIKDIETLLCSVYRLLKPNGRLIARVPSGDSPFSGAMYNGDLTHQSYLGSGKVEQLAIISKLRLERLGGAALPLRRVGLRKAARRVLVHVIRKSVNFLLRIGYYNNQKRVLDPNMVIVLVRPKE